MLPADYQPRIGDTLIDDQTNTAFVVLCSCPKSSPREHTRRYIQQHPSRFSFLARQAVVPPSSPPPSD